MGCDIHGVVQRKWEDDGVWETVEEIDRDRNYALFSALAGVRSRDDSEPAIPPRGLPMDFAGIPDTDGEDHPYELHGIVVPIWMGDHSHSWMTLEEAESVSSPDVVGEQWCVWLRWIRLKYAQYSPSIRIVFGFDN